jgi:hypothetical protein
VDCAFDPVAFDPVAFDVCVSATSPGTDKWKRKKRYIIYREATAREKEIEEMRLSSVLEKQLRDAQFMNMQLIEMSKQMIGQMQAAKPPEGEKGKDKKTVQPPPEPAKPVDPRKREMALAALQKAREVKEAKKQREAEIAKQRLKNLAKARRVQKKQRGK